MRADDTTINIQVGKTASIDRGWLLFHVLLTIACGKSRKNSLD